MKHIKFNIFIFYLLFLISPLSVSYGEPPIGDGSSDMLVGDEALTLFKAVNEPTKKEIGWLYQDDSGEVGKVFFIGNFPHELIYKILPSYREWILPGLSCSRSLKKNENEFRNTCLFTPSQLHIPTIYSHLNGSTVTVNKDYDWTDKIVSVLIIRRNDLVIRVDSRDFYLLSWTKAGETKTYHN